jgi:ubiquitin carboxyl-terminal hydrolase 4/11/15
MLSSDLSRHFVPSVSHDIFWFFFLQVVEHGMFVKHCKVELYLIEFKLAENSDLANTRVAKFSKVDTLGKLSWFLLMPKTDHH